MSKAKLPTHYGSISEKAFTHQVITLAKYLGWRTAHFRPGKTQRGRWVTPVQGDGAGFPDLVLAHDKLRQVIFAELKTEIGKLSESQHEWIFVLRECPVRAFIWRPSDINEIEEVLSGKGG